MSTTVSYKGSNIATVKNETKTLTTAGKWVEGNITLTDESLDYPIFTMVYNSSYQVTSVTCNKTYSEVYNIVNSSEYIGAVAHQTMANSSEEYVCTLGFTGQIGIDSGNVPSYLPSAGDYMVFTLADTQPRFDIWYCETGTITYVDPSTLRLTLNATANGTYTPVDGSYIQVNVEVEPEDYILEVEQDPNDSYLYLPTEPYDDIMAGIQEANDNNARVFIATNYATVSGFIDQWAYGNNDPPYMADNKLFFKYTTYRTYSENYAGTVIVTQIVLGLVNGVYDYAIVAREDAYKGTLRTSSDLMASGATVTVPGGFYQNDATKTIASGTATPAASISATGASISTGTNTLTLSKTVSNTPQVSAGYISSGTAGNSSVSLTASVNTRSSSDLTVSGKTVTAPAGYYAAAATKTISSGSVGNPTISVNSSGLITATATATAGYITSGTKSATLQLTTQAGTTIIPSTSQVVAVASGRYTTGTVTVAAITAGTAGTPIANKGAISNHAVTITPTVTNTTGYITGGTKNGIAVTVSVSELVSGTLTITSNGTQDVTNYATVSINVEGGGSGSSDGLVVASTSKTLLSAASSIQFTGLSGQPTSFVITSSADQTTGGTKVVSVAYDGTSFYGMDITTQMANDSGFTQSYSNGTLTVTTTSASFQANEYKLVYSYGGSAEETKEVQVGSGATSITFTGLTDEPQYFACIFTSTFSTSSGYQRVVEVVYDGDSTYGHAMDSSAKLQTS